MNEIVKIIPMGVFYHRDSDKAYFGHCFNPEHENFQANVGEDNWFYCPICKIKWYQGSGNFSDPELPMDKLVELWRNNEKMLDSYKDMRVNPIFYNKDDKKEYFGVD